MWRLLALGFRLRATVTGRCWDSVVCVGWSVMLLLPIVGIACSEESALSDSVATHVQSPQAGLIVRRLFVIANVQGADSAGFLSKPRAAEETADGRIYVLDSDWKTVLVYRGNGSYLGRLGDGYGLRPGQFALPVDMALHDSVLYVLDYEQQRVTSFGLDGEVRDTFGWRKRQARLLAVSSAGIWLRFMFPESGYWAGLFDRDGQLQRLEFPAHATDSAFADAGAGGAIAAVRGSQDVRYAHGSGAFVQTASGSGSVRRLSALEPLPAWTPLRDSTRVPEQVVYGMVAWVDGFLELTARYSGPPGSLFQELHTTYGIALYDSAGTLLGEAPLPDGTPTALDLGAKQGTILVSYMDPPKVMKLELEISDKLRRSKGSP